MKRKEYKIGEVFEYEGRMVECVESDSCDGCFVSANCRYYLCGKVVRSDGKYVKFVEAKQLHVDTGQSLINWEQRRYKLAKVAMRCIMSNGTIHLDNEAICSCSIAMADEMIKQLKQSNPNVIPETLANITKNPSQP